MLVTTAMGMAANIMKGLRLPNRDIWLSEAKPTKGPMIASQTDPTALMAPAIVGATPATVVRYKRRYVPLNV